MHVDKILSSHLFSRLSSPISFMITFYVRCSSLLIILLAVFWTPGFQSIQAVQIYLTKAEQKGRIRYLLEMIYLTQLRRPLVTFVMSLHCTKSF